MDARLQELHLLTNTIFQNIGCLTPYLRNVVTHAKQYQKSFQSTCNVADSFILSFQSLADAACISNGATKVVGHVLNDIIASFQEVEQMQVELMKLFINEVIIPLESKAEEEISGTKISHKGYMRDSKIQTELVERARQDVVKVRKKSLKKKSKALKYEQREKECVRTLAESEQRLQEVREQGLRMALIEERRIYCFVSERMCAFSHGMITHNGKMNQLLNDRLPDWMSGIQRPTELPAESEPILEDPTRYQYGTLKKKPKRTMSIRSRTDSASSPLSRRTSSASSKYHTMDNRNRRQGPSPSFAAPIARQLSSESVPIMSQRAPLHAQHSYSSGSNSTSPASSPTDDTSDPFDHNRPIETNGTTFYHEEHPHDTQSVGDMRMSSLRDQLSRRLMQIRPESKMKLKAMYDHAAQDPSQLSFHKNDIIVPICEPTSGWQYGENTSTELSGWFPSAYAEPLEHASDPARGGTLPVRRDSSNAAPHPPETDVVYHHEPPSHVPYPEPHTQEAAYTGETTEPTVRRHSQGLPPPVVAPKPKWHHNNNIPLATSPSSSSLPVTSAPAVVWSAPGQAPSNTIVVPLVNGDYPTPDTAPVKSAPLLPSTAEEDESELGGDEGPCMPVPPPPPPPPPMITAGDA